MKYFKLFLVCSISFIILSGLEVRAYGYPFQPEVDYFTWEDENENECAFKLDFCVSCSGISPLPITVKDIKLTKISGDCVGEPSREWLMDRILQRLNTPCVVPPCSLNQSILVSMYFPVCRKYVNVDIGGGNYYMSWQTCDESEGACLLTFDICYDPSTSKIVIKEIPGVNAECYGAVNCESEVPLLPPIGYSMEEEWESDCWLYDDCEGECDEE